MIVFQESFNCLNPSEIMDMSYPLFYDLLTSKHDREKKKEQAQKNKMGQVSAQTSPRSRRR